jgi:hypothetical protein
MSYNPQKGFKVDMHTALAAKTVRLSVFLARLPIRLLLRLPSWLLDGWVTQKGGSITALLAARSAAQKTASKVAQMTSTTVAQKATRSLHRRLHRRLLRRLPRWLP